MFIVNRGGRYILPNFQRGKLRLEFGTESNSKPRGPAGRQPCPPCTIPVSRAPDAQGWHACRTPEPSGMCISRDWPLLPSVHLSAQVPSRSIFYLFNTSHCQGVCNLLPGTGWNGKRLLLSPPPARCKSPPLWPARPPLLLLDWPLFSLLTPLYGGLSYEL